MAIDKSYTQALADLATEPPHVVLLGPVPCGECGAWLEWAGVDWVALATKQRHECAPFLAAGRTWRSRPVDQAHPMVPSRSLGAQPQLVLVPPPPALNFTRLAWAIAAVVALALVVAYWPR